MTKRVWEYLLWGTIVTCSFVVVLYASTWLGKLYAFGYWVGKR